MKLKNKISGEIKEFALFDGNELQGGVTLEILTKEWEDYEEPNLIPDQIFLKGSRVCIDYKNAEAGRKALEKLEAWKRLKDKGFRFDNCKIEMSKIVVPEITITAFVDTEEPETLNLVNMLFGGEE